MRLKQAHPIILNNSNGSIADLLRSCAFLPECHQFVSSSLHRNSSVSVKLKHCTPKDEYPLIILIYFRRSLAVYPRFLAPLLLSFSLSVFFFSPSLVLHLANFFPFLCSPLAKIAMSYPTNVNTFHA